MKRLLVKAYFYVIWLFSAIIERFNLKMSVNNNQVDLGRILVLAPHADDEWIGCSTILRKYKDSIVCNMDMEGGDSQKVHRLRREELSSLCSKYQLTLITIEDNKIERLASAIRHYDVQTVCVPYFYDWHQEHLAVMDLLQGALEIVGRLAPHSITNILMYQVSIPIPYSQINYLNPMAFSEWREKWKSFRNVYKSQDIPYFRFSMYELITGGLSGVLFAEPFVVYKTDYWVENNKKLRPSNEEMSYIKNNINSIRKILRFRNKK